ncbi:MAG: sodium:solute symporter family protein [Melioribacteraceae bacterium]|nr:sodium:solute symporter family protein [Melioribacteraceae bacterium]
MVSFSTVDVIIILIFFLSLLIIGFIPNYNRKDSKDAFLLSGRNVGIVLFVLTNVATWYGGILGVGEFTYKYGLLSWFTQGLPYYIFALFFAFLLAPKIRESSLYTIPDKLELTYGKGVGLATSVLIYLLVSPAAYILMLGNMISLILGISFTSSLFIGFIVSVIYLFKGGYKSDLYTDAFQFFIMFGGFIILFVFLLTDLGGVDFLQKNLPESHLSFTGNASVTYIIVWFLVALWTFTDPGFHQRCYAARTPKVAKYGILISIIFWMLFDFLTTATGLYSRAVLPESSNAVMAFPLLAESVLPPGLKGVFYAALFATIISTLNSYFFLSATTFSKDLISKNFNVDSSKLVKYTRVGLAFTGIIGITLALYLQSVIEIWYTIGSICIPGLILLIISAYYEKFRISSKAALIEVIFSVVVSVLWMIIRTELTRGSLLFEIEPMILGLVTALIIHTYGLLKRRKRLLMK